MKLREVIEEVETRPGKVFDIAIQILIVFSLLSFSLETLPNLSEMQKIYLRNAEFLIVLLFTIEYGLRLYVAKPKIKFVFSFFGMMDLLAIAPFYLLAGTDTRYFRALRLLRLMRTFKLVRYSAAANRLHRALLLAKEEIILYLVFTVFLLFFSSVGIYHFEYPAQPEVFSSIFHSLWWSVTTLTTVGYGDTYPITMGGRIFTFFVLIIGLGVVAVPAGLVASALSAAREMEDE